MPKGIKQTTIAKVLQVMQDLHGGQLQGFSPQDITKQYALTPGYLKVLGDLGYIDRSSTGLTWKGGEPTRDLSIRVINLNNQKATPKNHVDAPSHYLPFDEAVNFASDVATVGLMSGIEPNKIPDFIQEIATLFKKYGGK